MAGGHKAKRRTVLLTGIAGTLGQLTARRLHRHHNVVGVDRRPMPSRAKDIVHMRLDIRRKALENVFRRYRPDAVIHLGVMHDPRQSAEEHHTFNVIGTTRLLEHCHKYGVEKVVVLSSANVYGPRADTSGFLNEDAPLLAAQSFAEMRDLIVVDMLAQGFFWKHPGIETVILRPVHILGRVRNAPSNYLRLNPIPTLMGFDPMVQLISDEDVAKALELALAPRVRGVFNLTGPGQLPLSMAIDEVGGRRLPLPEPLARRALNRMWSWRLTTFPPPELDHIKYSCLVDGERAARELGFTPDYTLRDTLRAVINLA
ncbi:MAG: SDR family oxidoreductase [Myxococcota bacterium]